MGPKYSFRSCPKDRYLGPTDSFEAVGATATKLTVFNTADMAASVWHSGSCTNDASAKWVTVSSEDDFETWAKFYWPQPCSSGATPHPALGTYEAKAIIAGMTAPPSVKFTVTAASP